MAIPEAISVDIDGRSLRLTSLDKTYWPEAGYTKGQMLAYYAAIAPVLLPHTRRRAMTLKRFPEGVEGPFWFQLECPRPPPWMLTVAVDAAGDDRVFKHCVVEDESALLWAANLGTIEFQPSLWTIDVPQDASFVVLDLDPGSGATIIDCCQAALDLRDLLDSESLPAYVKTSGRKGLHMYLPLTQGTTFDHAKALARSLAAELARRHPDRIVDNVAVAHRTGKVLIDWRQTARLRQLCCPYSLRAGPYPTVSMPLTWDEVGTSVKSRSLEHLVFSPDDALARIDDVGDLFAPLGEPAD